VRPRPAKTASQKSTVDPTNRSRRPQEAITSAKSDRLAQEVRRIVATTPVSDIHTHLYDPAFGPLLLWGIDDLLVYHYLVAEAFRQTALPYERFWALSKTDQARLIWDELFVQHSPLSEACRGVLTTLQRLGLDPRKRDLPSLRKWFNDWNPRDYISHCLDLANVSTVCMTNSPFDPTERRTWENGFERDSRFLGALRIDPLLLDWPQTSVVLRAEGYVNGPDLSQKNLSGIRRFLSHWTRRLEAKYLMVSLPPNFAFPDGGPCATLIEQAVLPHCRDFGLPFALMMGVKRGINPLLQMAGDGSAPSNLNALTALCTGFPQNKFLVTVLARENQHELCIIARKFRNLHIFGCWWFMNIPHIVEEMTRMRLELLGPSFTPQHSDARILDQLIYKWDHSRKVITKVLVDKYLGLLETGWGPSPMEIERDVRELFGGSFKRFSSG
jgi:hypothetical protein